MPLRPCFAWKVTLVVFPAFLLLLIPSLSAAEPTPEILLKELDQVRAQLMDKQKEAVQFNQKFMLRKRELEYKDPEATLLRQRIVEIERELIGLRKELSLRLVTIEELKVQNRERERLFNEVKTLKETEMMILKEMASAKYRTPEKAEE